MVFDDALAGEVRGAVSEARRLALASQPPPPLVASPKCPRCSLVGICLPDEITLLHQQEAQPPPAEDREGRRGPRARRAGARRRGRGGGAGCGQGRGRGRARAARSRSRPRETSGHTPAGPRSERPPLAIVPLPNVASAHAEGHLMGVALVLPRDATSEDHRALRRALGRWSQERRAPERQRAERAGEALATAAGRPLLPVHLGAAGTLWLRLLEDDADQRGLQAGTWSQASRLWVTATPIALDRNPGELWSGVPARRGVTAASPPPGWSDAGGRCGQEIARRSLAQVSGAGSAPRPTAPP